VLRDSCIEAGFYFDSSQVRSLQKEEVYMGTKYLSEIGKKMCEGILDDKMLYKRLFALE
jgi:hypothetical protein